MLQDSSGCLSHEIDEVICRSPKKVTFDNGGRSGLKGEIVSASVDSPCVGDDF